MHETGGFEVVVFRSVQSTLSHQKSTSVPRATFTRFLMMYEVFQCY